MVDMNNMDYLFDGLEDPDMDLSKDMPYQLNFIKQTDKAIQVFNLEHCVGDAFFLPKSQIEVDGVNEEADFDNLEEGSVITVYVPEWLARRNDLI